MYRSMITDGIVSSISKFYFFFSGDFPFAMIVIYERKQIEKLSETYLWYSRKVKFDYNYLCLLHG